MSTSIFTNLRTSGNAPDFRLCANNGRARMTAVEPKAIIPALHTLIAQGPRGTQHRAAELADLSDSDLSDVFAGRNGKDNPRLDRLQRIYEALMALRGEGERSGEPNVSREEKDFVQGNPSPVLGDTLSAPAGSPPASSLPSSEGDMPTLDHKILYAMLAALPLALLPEVKRYLSDLWSTLPTTAPATPAEADRKVSGK